MHPHELSDEEEAVIAPLLPTTSRGVERIDDRRVINRILWRFRTGSFWRDLTERYGPRTTLDNRWLTQLMRSPSASTAKVDSFLCLSHHRG